MALNNDDQFLFDVALSFAGEDRPIVDKFARLLKAKNIKYFYDETESADLWGKDLIAHLADVYENQARYCIMFISKHYPLKRWTNFERTHIQARAFRDTNEYILPIRLDDAEVPGIAETLAHRDIRQHSLESIAYSLEQKLAKAKGQSGPPPQSHDLRSGNIPSATTQFGDIPMPKRDKTFTELQKDRFAKESFEFIREYFQQALKQLKIHDSEIETDLTKIHNWEFRSKIYVKEAVRCECRIWLGERNTIFYNGERGWTQGNSYSESLNVEDNKEELRLRISGFGIGMGIPMNERLVTKEKGAEYLWKLLTSRL